MKTIIRPKLNRKATIGSRILVTLSLAALLLLASCTTSHPVLYNPTGSAEILVALPEATETAPKDGHATRKKMQCWRCDGVSWIWHNADSHTDYTCPFCSAVNTL